MGRFKRVEMPRSFAGKSTEAVRSDEGTKRHLKIVPDEAAQRISHILQDSDLVGAVISGPTGSGRRTTVALGCTFLPETPQITRLNGSAFGSQIPMGVLAFLLAKLELDSEASRHELVHSLGRLLCPNGISSVVLLARPELIDEESGSLLAQLAVMKKIKLIVVCELIQNLPRDILALLRSGKLEQVTVSKRNTTQTRAFLETELNGPISVFAVATLQHLCDGNRGLMKKLVRVWISHGQMVQKSGIWVLRTTELANGPAVRTLFNSMISGLDEAELALLFALAFGGPVSMDEVHRAGLTRSVDGLFAGGHVHHVRQNNNRVMITVPLLAMLLRLQVDAEMSVRSQNLMTALHADPATVQILTKMRSLMELGQIREIISVGEAFASTGYTAGNWAITPYLKTDIIKIHAKSLLRMGEPGKAAFLIDGASRGLHRALEEDRVHDKLLRANQELELLKQSTKIANYDSAICAEDADTEVISFHTTQWMTEGMQTRALAIQALGLAKQSQHDDAQQLVMRISRDLQSMSFSGAYEDGICQEELGETESILLHCELLAGLSVRAMARASELSTGKYANPRLIAHAEMIRGILLGLQGEPERSLRILEPCLSQLELLEQGNERPAVQSVVSHALLSVARRAEGTELLFRSSETELPTTPTNFQSWAAEIFDALSLALFDSVEYALIRLLAFAGKLEQTGQTALEMHTLAFALRLGHRESATKLEALAAASQGSIAESYRKMAQNVYLGAPQELESMKHLAESGFTLITLGADNALVETLDVKDQRKLAKKIGMLKRLSPSPQQIQESKNDEAQQPVLGGASELTKREAQIAGMAISGKSNQEIARFNGVSIRTVEGHLYQVYAKLQVRNRQELTAMERASRRVVEQR